MASNQNHLVFNLQKMTSFVLTGILFVLNFVSFPCEGTINLLGGNKVIVLAGDNVTIQWTFDDTITSTTVRTWTFTSSSNGSKPEDIAVVFANQPVTIIKSSLPRFEVNLQTTRATLVLRKVDRHYDGTYYFSISKGGSTEQSDVTLYIKENSTVTTNCSSLIKVNEGDDIRCLCRARVENPPVIMNVTWYKDDAQIGPTRDEQNMLTLINVNGTSNGIYVCKAKGNYNLTGESNSTVVEVSVPPLVTSFTSSPNNPFRGQSVTLTCVASGRPEPTIIIKHNGKMVDNTTNTHTINDVEDSDTGLYECFAKNELGNSSETLNLTVIAPTTKPTATSRSKPGNKTGPTTVMSAVPTTNSSNKDKVRETTTNACICKEVIVWHAVVFLLSGIIIGILLSCIFGYFSRRFRNKKPTQSNPEPQTFSKVDSIYQDLDLSKMNQEENYQTLGAVNSGHGESDYTELNLVRDVEENYQSLQTST